MNGNMKSTGPAAANIWFSLLEKIDELGSITKAAKVVGISHKTAWDTLNKINVLADKPLVESVSGGKGGGGSSLTAEGKKFVWQFKAIQEAHYEFLRNLEDRLGDSRDLYQFLRRLYNENQRTQHLHKKGE